MMFRGGGILLGPKLIAKPKKSAAAAAKSLHLLGQKTGLGGGNLASSVGKKSSKDAATIKEAAPVEDEEDSHFMAELDRLGGKTGTLAERDAEEAVAFRHYGMGGFVTPPGSDGKGGVVRPFEGLFRQSWRDFHVTEMLSATEQVSRVPKFSLPEFPAAVGEMTSSSSSATDAMTKESLFRLDDGETQLAEAKADVARFVEDDGDGDEGAKDPSSSAKSGAFTECILHKQSVAHSTAISALSQILRISPKQISFAGVKDFEGDTIQRIRVRGVAPQSLLAANSQFQGALKQRGFAFLRCSNFSYASEPLERGDLYGNHFKVTLREVSGTSEDIQLAVDGVREHGFPNYYGCQRFAWFGGKDDPAFAVAHGDFLRFAFKFLDYTDSGHSLRELLQRKKKYPIALQDAYRRLVIRGLAKYDINPERLDTHRLFSRCPEVGAMFLKDTEHDIKPTERIVLEVLCAAFLDLEGPDRRMRCQTLQSFLWNQALTTRLKMFGRRVLIGDFVIPKGLREATVDGEMRIGWTDMIQTVTPENIHQYTIEDVVHPGFQLNSARLPQNEVRDIYDALCERYALVWSNHLTREGIYDFLENPRPIVRKPTDFTFDFDAEKRVLEMKFVLERGCYATVMLTELTKRDRCYGDDKVTLLPLPRHAWDVLGTDDPAYVMTFQDINPGFIETDDGYEVVSEVGRFDNQVPLSMLSDEELRLREDDEVEKLRKWSKENLVHQVQRREIDAERQARRLFDRSLAKGMTPDEVDRYASHTTELPPNADIKRIKRELRRRAERSVGSPRFRPRVALGSSKKSGGRGKPQYKTLDKNAWNRTTV